MGSGPRAQSDVRIIWIRTQTHGPGSKSTSNTKPICKNQNHIQLISLKSRPESKSEFRQIQGQTGPREKYVIIKHVWNQSPHADFSVQVFWAWGLDFVHAGSSSNNLDS